MGRIFELPDSVAEQVAEGLRIAVIVGDAGCGKSTWLAAFGRLAERQGRPWLYRHLLREPPGEPPAGGWWLLDEAQDLRAAELLALVERGLADGGCLALASHRPLTRRLERLAPTLRVRLTGLRGPAETEALVASWLAASGHEVGAWFEPAALAQLARLGRGVPRWVVRLCYELAEDRQPGRPISAADVVAAEAKLRRDAPALFLPPTRSKPCPAADPSSSLP